MSEQEVPQLLISMEVCTCLDASTVAPHTRPLSHLSHYQKPGFALSRRDAPGVTGM